MVVRGSATDVRQEQVVSELARSEAPDVIFNCAGYTRVDECERHPERAMAVNGEAVAGIARAAEAVGAKLVQISTDYVFDGTASRPYREGDPTSPLSVYGRSKLAGEEAALAIPGSLVVRTSWLFGHGGANFVRTVWERLRLGRPLCVVRDQVGCPTYTPYLAAALWEPAVLNSTGVLHYRNREPTSWHGFAVAIARLANIRSDVQATTTHELSQPAARPPYSVLDVSKVETMLERPVEAWEAGLEEYLEICSREVGT